MLTSANLSKQAWGDVENKNGEVWIQSWETGVVVWPGLFAGDAGVGSGEEGKEGERVKMVPTFGTDMPNGDSVGAKGGIGSNGRKVVGFRMPYDLPLEAYGDDEVPWCATSKYSEPDWKVKTWGGY
jgi:tyrosyl-DNA phosphodiesterase-1